MKESDRERRRESKRQSEKSKAFLDALSARSSGKRRECSNPRFFRALEVIATFFSFSALFAPCALSFARCRVARFPRVRELERALDARGSKNGKEREERRSGS